MRRLGNRVLALRESFWFIPGIGIVVAPPLGVVLIDVETHMNLAERWPRLFGYAAEGTRRMLTAIAGSMITPRARRSRAWPRLPSISSPAMRAAPPRRAAFVRMRIERLEASLRDALDPKLRTQ